MGNNFANHRIRNGAGIIRRFGRLLNFSSAIHSKSLQRLRVNPEGHPTSGNALSQQFTEGDVMFTSRSKVTLAVDKLHSEARLFEVFPGKGPRDFS